MAVGIIRAATRIVGNDAKLRLAIRTVAVTARVAVKSHERRGNPKLAAASARRGLVLLDQIRQSLEDGDSREARAALEAAETELRAAADRAGTGTTAASVDADDRAVEEDVDVRSELGS